MRLSILALCVVAIGMCPAADTKSSPIACNMNALNPAQRTRHADLMKRLRSDVAGRIEVADGFTYKLTGKVMTLPEIGEWINLERLCCPFLTFQLQVAGIDGSAAMTLRGPEGTKLVLQEEFPK